MDARTLRLDPQTTSGLLRLTNYFQGLGLVDLDEEGHVTRTHPPMP